MKAEVGQKSEALLAAEAQRDTALLKLQRARSGMSSVRSSAADGVLSGACRASDCGEGPLHDGDVGTGGGGEAVAVDDEDHEVDIVVKKYLEKIARLEREVKRLKQVCWAVQCMRALFCICVRACSCVCVCGGLGGCCVESYDVTTFACASFFFGGRRDQRGST